MTQDDAPLPGAATLADVAEAARVSLATASRVFSSPALVRDATAQRVLDAARTLRFRPNLLGSKLRAQRTRMIGVMLPTLENAVFAECWHGIEEAALAAGYSLMLVTSGYRPERERERVEYLLRHRVDGMVLTVADAARSAVLDQLDTEDIPYVLAYNKAGRAGGATRSRWTTAPAPAPVYRPCWPPGTGASPWCRAPSSPPTVRASASPATRRHACAGPRARPALCLPSHTASNADQLAALMAGPGAPTALFCTNDLLAIGVISDLRRTGLRVPADVSVLGYDGIALGTAVEPALATVAQPSGEIGAQAIARLLARLEHGAAPAGARVTLLAHALRPAAPSARRR